MRKFVLVCICFFACQKESELSESDRLSETLASAHFIYHFSNSDATKVDTVWQEEYISIILDSLQIKLSEKIHFYKYRDREHLKRINGKVTNGFAEPGTLNFHTIWPIDNHECIHNLIIKYFGHPPALWNEGIAVALQFNFQKYKDKQARWNGVVLSDWSKQFLQQNKLPGIQSLISSTDFFKHDTNITYPMAGAFVSYLITTYGWFTFKKFITMVSFNATSAITLQAFQSAYGHALESIWNDWLLTLQ